MVYYLIFNMIWPIFYKSFEIYFSKLKIKELNELNRSIEWVSHKKQKYKTINTNQSMKK